MYGPSSSPMPMPPSMGAAGAPAGNSALLQALMGGQTGLAPAEPALDGMDDPVLQQILMQLMMEQGGAPAGAGGMMPPPRPQGMFPGGGY